MKREDTAWSREMKKVVGFALFFVAVGMLVMLMLPNEFLGFFLIFICLILGYNLFCG